MQTLVCTFSCFLIIFLYQVLEDCKWFHVLEDCSFLLSDSLRQINFRKKCFASFAFLRLEVYSVHYLTLPSLTMAIWPPVNFSSIFLSEQIKLLCQFNYNVKQHSKNVLWKNISKEIDKAMEWFQWLTWSFHLVVALFFYYCHTLFFIRI